jgi:hypothetical protein
VGQLVVAHHAPTMRAVLKCARSSIRTVAIMTMAPAACAQAAYAGRDRRGAGQDFKQRQLCRYRIARSGTSADADCGSVPSSTTSRPGASNAAHANLEGGRIEPISTATSRVLMASDQTPCDPRLRADRRQLPPAGRRVTRLARCAGVTPIRVAPRIRQAGARLSRQWRSGRLGASALGPDH